MPTLRYRVRRTEQLDRLAWAGGFTFDLHGAVIGVRTSDRSALARLRRVMPPGARPSVTRSIDAMYSLVVETKGTRRSVGRTHTLYEDARRIARGANADVVLATLASALEFKVAVCARTRLYVHAGVVGWRGGAMLIPGRTHTGKSSLVVALVRAGATYYSDEYAVLDDAGYVHPFARPLGIRDAAGRTQRVSPAALGATVGEMPLRVSRVVVTHHRAGARWRPKAMSPGETVLALLENTVAAQHRPADALRILGAAVAKAQGIRGPRGEASRVATRILTQDTHLST